MIEVTNKCCGDRYRRVVLSFERALQGIIYVCLNCGSLWNEWATTSMSETIYIYPLDAIPPHKWVKQGVIDGDLNWVGDDDDG